MTQNDFIYKRRSIRKFTPEPVNKSQIRELLRAAMAAPSAGDQRPWEFVVITNRKLLDAVPSLHPYSKMIKEAPAAILVCGNMRKQKHGHWDQDCSAATENLLLAAANMGLGAVWLGVYPVADRVEGLSGLFKLPKHVIPLSLVPVGHPAETKSPCGDRYDETCVHSNYWSGN